MREEDPILSRRWMRCVSAVFQVMDSELRALLRQLLLHGSQEERVGDGDLSAELVGPTMSVAPVGSASHGGGSGTPVESLGALPSGSRRLYAAGLRAPKAASTSQSAHTWAALAQVPPGSPSLDRVR